MCDENQSRYVSATVTVVCLSVHHVDERKERCDMNPERKENTSPRCERVSVEENGRLFLHNSFDDRASEVIRQLSLYR